MLPPPQPKKRKKYSVFSVIGIKKILFSSSALQLESGDVQDASLNGRTPPAFYIHITADLQMKEFNCAVEMETSVA
jgi:hypothetical protein